MSERTSWKRGRNAGPEADLRVLNMPVADTRYAADVARQNDDDRTESQMRSMRRLDRDSRYDLTPFPKSKRSSSSCRKGRSRQQSR